MPRAAILQLPIGLASDAVLRRGVVKTPATTLPAARDWSLLLRRIAGGEEEALATLYDEASALVFGLARRIVWDHTDAEDVTAEVFAQVWVRAASYDATLGSAATWLLTMARNRAIDRLRKKQREAPTEPMDALSSLASDTDIEEQAGSEQQSVRLRRALSGIGADQRRAIELAFFAGLSHTEIARRLGEPVGTIKTRIRLAMNKLRTLLREPAGKGSREALSR